jgi:hypothetical protein
MILEDITGEVKVSLGNKALAIGDSFEDADYGSVSVVGKGKATFRVDQNSTVERYGIKPQPAAEPKVAPKAVKPAAETPPVAETPPTEAPKAE